MKLNYFFINAYTSYKICTFASRKVKGIDVDALGRRPTSSLEDVLTFLVLKTLHK